jgi:hypothetical protein
MKTRNIICIALAVIFNDFVGSLIVATGLLFMKMGNLIANLPTIF